MRRVVLAVMSAPKVAHADGVDQTCQLTGELGGCADGLPPGLAGGGAHVLLELSRRGIICGMRRLCVLLCVGTCVLVAGCGGSDPASTATADAQVNYPSCQASGRDGKPTRQSCTFVLSDGRRLGCNRTFDGPAPGVPELLRDGCRWLTPLKLSGAMRDVIARISRARSCLTSKRLRADGGPAFPSRPPDPTQPDGELVISSTHPTFIAFYTDLARAKRIEPALQRDDSGKHVLLERRGAVTIVWTQTPADELRHTVWVCVA